MQQCTSLCMPIIFILCIAICSITENALAQKKLSKQEIEQLFQRSQQALEKNQPAEALKILNLLAQYSPNDANVFQNRAYTYLALSNPESALQDAQKAIGINTNMPGAYFSRGTAYLRLGRYDAALADFQHTLKFFPKNASIYYNIATVYTYKNKPYEAIQALNKCIEYNPKYVEAYSMRAYMKAQRNDPSLEQDLLTAIRINPSFYEAYENLTQFYIGTNKLPQAAEMLKKRIQMQPDNILNYTMFGYISLQSNKYNEAINAFSTALAKDSSDIKARGYRAVAYYFAQQYRESVSDCNIFFRQNPFDVRQNALGGSLMERSANSSLQGAPILEHSKMYSLRGMARRMLGQEGWQYDIRKSLLLGQSEQQILSLQDGFSSVADLLESNVHQDKLWSPRYNEFPESLQFFPRNANDSASIIVSGVIRRIGYDSVTCAVFKNNTLVRRFVQPLVYSSSTQAQFSFQPSIHAEKSIYRMELSVKNATKDTLLAVRDSLVCGDAYIVSGQSNSVHGTTFIPANVSYLRTFRLGTTEDSFWAKPPATDNTLASAFMEQLINATSVPIAVVNGGLNGTKIEQHLPTATNDPSTLFGRLKMLLTASKLAPKAKGVIWYQGESNPAEQYAECFDTLYTAWKQAYTGLQRIYVIQTRPSDCSPLTQDLLREVQRTFGEKYSDVSIIASASMPAHDGCHYENVGYIALGRQIAALVYRDLYNKQTADTIGIASPNLIRAEWSSAKRDEILLTFASNDSLVCGADTTIQGKLRTLANDAFLLDGKPIKAASVRSEGQKIILTLSASSSAKTISYIPEKCYAETVNGVCTTYEGPWITTRRGAGVLTFANQIIR